MSRFAYIKNGCRVYFSDVDILTMLLEIEDKNTMDRLLQALIKAYYEEQKEQYYIRIGRSQYMHTISKYITLLKYYYYGNKKAGKFLQQMGYDTEKSIYQNYDTTAKRDEKRWYFFRQEKMD